MGEAIGGKSIDLEWVQVHPTGLVKPDDPDAKIKFLAAEALRGVGGLVFDAMASAGEAIRSWSASSSAGAAQQCAKYMLGGKVEETSLAELSGHQRHHGAETRTQKDKDIADTIGIITNGSLKGGAKKAEVVKVL